MRDPPHFLLPTSLFSPHTAQILCKGLSLVHRFLLLRRLVEPGALEAGTGPPRGPGEDTVLKVHSRSTTLVPREP